MIGTGASAIQIVPELQQVAGHLDVYQRTAPWVIPRNDRTYGASNGARCAGCPRSRRLYRTGIYWAHEGYVPGFTLEPKLAAPAKKGRRPTSPRASRTRTLRAKVTPYFELGCKRVLRSNTYYPALAADNVELVTDPIAKVTGDAIVTADGVERPVDVIVVATGFYTTELPIAEHISGRAGAPSPTPGAPSGMAAYKGTTVPGFPNLFMLVGPNTGQGHTSMVFIIESQVAYIRDAIRTMRERGYAAVEPRADAHAEVERRPPAPDEAHRVDPRRLPELVPRRARPQHRALAESDVHVPAARSRVRRDAYDVRPAPRPPARCSA